MLVATATFAVKARWFWHARFRRLSETSTFFPIAPLPRFSTTKLAALVCSLCLAASLAMAADPVRLGAVQSSTGAYAAEEKGLTDMLRMLVSEQNSKGGLLGRKIELVVADPGSVASAYVDGAVSLVAKPGISAIFAGVRQDSCNAVGDVTERAKVVLFCPGENTSPSKKDWTIQLGLPKQQRVIPAIEYLRGSEGIKNWVLASTDAAQGREVNGLVEQYLKEKGVSADSVLTQYKRAGSNDWTSLAIETSKLQAANSTAVVSTVFGDSNNAFIEAFDRLGPTPSSTPVLTVDDGGSTDTRTPAAGSLSARSYFESLDTAANRDLLRRWKAYSGADAAPITEAMAAEALGFSIWVTTVELASSPEPTQWRGSVQSVKVPGYAGLDVGIDSTNRILQSVLLGKAQKDGTYVVEARTPILTGDTWNPRVSDTKDLVAKWNSGANPCLVFDIGVGCSPTVDHEKRTVDLLIATTRKVETEPDTSLRFVPERAALTFGATRVSVPEGHSFGQVDRRSWVQFITLQSKSDTEFQIQEEKALSRDEFTAAIKNANPADALVYVHGFRNTFEDSAFRLAQIVWDTKYQGVPVVFSWPSRGTTAGYETDYDSAEYSAPAFRELLRTLKQDAHVATVHVIAHSMGSRVVLQGLLRSEPKLGDRPLGELIFAAPDVDRQIFAQQVEVVRSMAKGVTLYANKNDWALFASKQLRSQFVRAGDSDTPDGPLVAAGVDTIDISSVGKDFFSLNHSTFSESMLAMEEIASLLSAGVRPPDKRTHILVGMPKASSPAYWKFPD
ncbi:alpha/beta fold hydrolase [Rhizobium sp. 16-449-1b]|uniref:alpha/beta fold hydrolase n=1 Tax=Rhizobium sp. 16-449-1b TaxID=2819989 RepID=UPI001FFE0143|nr:alpha/beta fold hydrolase [Rhizobium sp. 16-449-1b]